MDLLCDRDAEILTRIQADFFRPGDFPVKIEIDFEGQKTDEERNFVIGCRAGPELHVDNLLHEMGHFAEREPKKLLRRPSYAWGYSFGKYWRVGGQCGHEMFTDQAVRRELKIWAFQWNLEKHYGIATTTNDLVESAVYISTFCYYYTYKDAARTRLRSDKERLVIAAAEVRHLAKTYTFEAFTKAWWERINLLQEQARRRHGKSRRHQEQTKQQRV